MNISKFLTNRVWAELNKSIPTSYNEKNGFGWSTSEAGKFIHYIGEAEGLLIDFNKKPMSVFSPIDGILRKVDYLYTQVTQKSGQFQQNTKQTPIPFEAFDTYEIENKKDGLIFVFRKISLLAKLEKGMLIGVNSTREVLGGVKVKAGEVIGYTVDTSLFVIGFQSPLEDTESPVSYGSFDPVNFINHFY